MITVSSDPHAYLRPIYRQVAADRTFAMLASETQYSLLVEAVSRQSEHRAALMREYTQPARMALLSHLAKAESLRPGPAEVMLWTLTKASRVLTCVALYLAHGVDLRLLEDGDVRRTQLVKDGPHAEALAHELRCAAKMLGWA